MRLLLVTGTAGVDTGEVCARYAVRAARGGVKTRLLAGPRAGDVEDWAGLGEPGLQVSSPGRGAKSPPAPFGTGLLAEVGDQLALDAVPESLVATMPGRDEIEWVLTLPDLVLAEGVDLLVADLGPARQACQLLAVPAGVRAVLDHLLPVSLRVQRAMTLPADPVGELADRLREQMSAAQSVLEAPSTRLRLMGTGHVERVRRWAPRVSAYGCRVEPLTGAVGDEDRPDEDRWVDEDVPGVSFGRRVVPEGEMFVLELALPLAGRGGLSLRRIGEDLVLGLADGVPPAVVRLPAVLQRCRAAGAVLDHAGTPQATLRVRFRPDPDLWRSP